MDKKQDIFIKTIDHQPFWLDGCGDAIYCGDCDCEDCELFSCEENKNIERDERID